MTVLANAVVAITGAGGGIGRGLAIAMARRGARLALCDLNGESLGETLRAVGSACVVQQTFSLDDGDALASFLSDAERVGPIDVFVNNAGVGYNGVNVWDAPIEDWAWVFDVNVFGALGAIRLVAPRMVARGAGHVVNVASISGLVIPDGVKHGVYGASKHALVGLTEALRQDLAPHGVRVTLVCPSGVKSSLPQSGRNRPQKYGGAFERAPSAALAAMLERAMSAEEFGELLCDAIERDDDIVVTGAEEWADVEAWHLRIKLAFERLGEVDRGLA